MADLAGKLPKNEILVRIVLAESIPLAHSGKPDKQTIQKFLQKAKIPGESQNPGFHRGVFYFSGTMTVAK